MYFAFIPISVPMSKKYFWEGKARRRRYEYERRDLHTLYKSGLEMYLITYKKSEKLMCCISNKNTKIGFNIKDLSLV